MSIRRWWSSLQCTAHLHSLDIHPPLCRLYCLPITAYDGEASRIHPHGLPRMSALSQFCTQFTPCPVSVSPAPWLSLTDSILSQRSRANVTSRSAANTTVIACFPRSSPGEEMQTNETHQRQHKQRDDCIRGLAAWKSKKNKQQHVKIIIQKNPPEGERWQTVRLRGRSGKRKPHVMATGSATRLTYGCHHLRNSTFQHSRVQLQLPFPRMPPPTPERLEKPTETSELKQQALRRFPGHSSTLKMERQLCCCNSDGQMLHEELIKATQSA